MTALEHFAGEDEARAAEAFATLSTHARRYLYVCLKDRVQSSDDLHDVIQQTLVKIWSARDRFENQGPAAFFRMLKVAAHRCWSSMQPAGAAKSVSEIEESDGFDIEVLIDRIFEVADGEAFFHAATVLFCGLDPRLPRGAHDRQLLAAQLYFLDRAPLDQIVRMLPALPGDSPRTLDQICAWLIHPGVLRHLAYTELYLSNSELVECMLARKWPETEALLIMWRYRYGLTVEEIARRADCPAPMDALPALCRRFEAALPFGKAMQAIMTSLRREPEVALLKPYRTEELWQRLAFQYRYQESLTHRDVHERCRDAADVAGYTMKLENLNMWLAGRRLLSRLSRFHDSQGGFERFEPAA